MFRKCNFGGENQCYCELNSVWNGIECELSSRIHPPTIPETPEGPTDEEYFPPLIPIPKIDNEKFVIYINT